MKRLLSPIAVTSIFKNETTIDCYTISIMLVNTSLVVATSSNPFHPQGVASVDEGGFIDAEEVTEEDKHIGKQIGWEDLPQDVQQYIHSLITDYNPPNDKVYQEILDKLFHLTKVEEERPLTEREQGQYRFYVETLQNDEIEIDFAISL